MMMRLFVVASVLALCRADSNWTDTTSRVLVHIPFPLHEAEGFAHVKADFGFHTVSSGRSIAEYVYFAEQTLCRPLVLAPSGNATNTKIFPATKEWPEHPFILMANKGDCSSVTQARHAQQVGASAFVIADQHCRCSNTKCTDIFRNDTCLDEAPALVNDGSGDDISIPTFLIFKILAHNLQETLKRQQPVLLELQWGIQDKNNLEASKPGVHFWTSAYDPLVNLEFYVSLRTVIKAFQGHASFAPRYSLIDGSRFSCNAQPDANAPCDHLCTNHGRYCTLHAKDLSGHAIVKETTRRLCIWKHFNQDQWFDYVIYHKERCSEPHKFADSTCLDDAIKAAKIDGSVLQSCMTDAGNMDEDVTNTLLDDEMRYLNRSGVVSLPAITVNRAVLTWTSPHSLFDTLCTEYWISASPKIPQVCETCGACPNAIGCLEKGKCVGYSDEQRHPDTGFKDEKKKGHHGWKVFWSLVLTMMLAAGGWYYYKTHYQQGSQFVNRNALLSNYLQLSGEEG